MIMKVADCPVWLAFLEECNVSLGIITFPPFFNATNCFLYENTEVRHATWQTASPIYEYLSLFLCLVFLSDREASRRRTQCGLTSSFRIRNRLALVP